MNLPWTRDDDCRLCSCVTVEIADLGTPALSCIFPRPEEAVPRIPLTVRHCRSCGLVQLGQNVDPSLMYREGYGYRSGINESMAAHLRDIVVYAAEFVGPGDSVLDIGCNDGTLLGCWGPKIRKYGVDPIAEDIDGVTVHRGFFHYRDDLPKFKVITSIAMFYDLPDPVGFARDVAKSLTNDGVWILEVQYAGALHAGLWDGICHEHLTYYGLRQIGNIAMQAGLHIADFEFNSTNGGSILVTLRKGPNLGVNYHRIADVAEAELRWDWSDLGERIAMASKNIRKAVHGYKTYVLGASTKGNTLLHTTWLDHRFIECAIERNPEKFGRVTPGTNIPIVSEDALWENPPQLLLVLPYHFREGLLERYGRLREQGVKFLFPLPDIEIV